MKILGKSILSGSVFLCSWTAVVRASDSININIPSKTGAEAPVCKSPDQDGCGHLKKHDDDDDSAYATPAVEWCRRRPTWRHAHQDIPDQIVRESCQKVLGYEPDLEAMVKPPHELFQADRDRPVLERPFFQKLATCLEDTMATQPTSTTNSQLKQPSIAKLYRRDDGLPIMAVVEDALSEEEAESVLALAHCLPKHFPKALEHRAFSDTQEGGGNDVTFLSGFLQIMVPGVAHSLQTAAKVVWEQAKWGEDDRVLVPYNGYYAEDGTLHSDFSTRWWPDPVSDCGIRTTEHLSYDRWQGLGFHEDGGSDYTVLVALSDPSEYQGGAFSLCPEYSNNPEHYTDPEGHRGHYECPGKISIKPPKRAAIVFLSEFSHGVETIESPGRVMFANELWRYGNVPATQYRPEPFQFVMEDYTEPGARTYG